MPVYLNERETPTIPPPGTRVIIVDVDGVVKQLKSDGSKPPIAGGNDMQSICRVSASRVLPDGFADYWTDLTGAADHSVSFSLNTNSTAVVNTESGGKRRLTTQATGPGVAEILPYYNQNGLPATEHLPTMINPKTSAWYVEGRAAIETHGANSILLPCSIALTSAGVIQVPGGAITGNTFVGLGLVGTGFSGGSLTFLSLIAVSAGVMLVQTTTIPWTSTMQAYALEYDGARTITARAYAPDGTVATWTTQNLNQIPTTPPGSNVGFHPNQWLMATDTTVTTMLCDYLYGAGPRT